MLSSIQIKLIIAVATGLIFVLLLGYGYKTAYNHGQLTAQQECVASMLKYQKDVQEKIDSIEKGLASIATITNAREKKLGQDIAKILEGVKKEPITIIEKGVCTPSPTFVKGINEAINRANLK